ncbi:MAG: glycosyltransferase [Candidatus Saccharimonadales bacterium]
MIEENIDLSIIVTAHNEGLIAHKTMLSIFQAVNKLENTKWEIIVSLDNGTADTLNYFKSLVKERGIKLLEVSFRDLSMSRNNAVAEACGAFVTFIDADDLMSADWLSSGLRLARTHNDAVIHPEYSVTFGDDNLIWQKRNSGSHDFDTLCLIDNNLWDSPCLAAREIFLNHPYHPNGNGFGYEDKKFNCDILASKLTHLVAPRSILFVRRKNSGSMLRTAIADRATVAKNHLLSYESISSIDLAQYEALHSQKETRTRSSMQIAKQTGKVILKKIHNRAKKNESYLKVIQPLRERRQAKINVELKNTYQDWMISTWRDIHKIDNTVFPAKELLKHLSWYNSDRPDPGICYAKLIQSFSKQPDTLFFVPHLIKGGADMVFINYSNELKSIYPDWNIAMLQTESKESVWQNKVSEQIDFVNLFDLFETLDNDTQHRLLATLVTQNDIKRIIIGNSQLAYDFVSKYQSLIKTLDISIYCFAFGEEFDEEGRLWGHIHTGIPKIYPVIYRIITDNENTVNKLSHEYAFDRARFAMHYQPTRAALKPAVQNDQKPLRILWASRVCKQKRPDIIKAISNELDQSQYSIDAWGQLEEGLTAHYFDDSNVHYRGSFNGINTLPISDYDIYIYTSEGDGVPNVLQEITASGLPIIASNVGGIREFIKTNITGMLIMDHESIEDYVDSVKKLDDTSMRKELNNNAQQLLTTKFSMSSWQESVRKDFDK